MADDNAVTVKFGASTEDLISGVDVAKASIQSLAGPVDEISSIFTQLGGLLAAAFSLDAIKSFVASMEQLGVQTERSSEMLGMTVEQVSGLNAISEMTGGSADTMTRGMERLSLTMEHAAAGGKMQQDAFRQLGVSYKDASGNLLPLDVMLGKVADRFAAAPNGIQKTALSIELFSRMGPELIKMLNQGSAGLKAYGDEAEKTGVVLSNQTVAGMTLAYRSGLSLTESLKGLGIEMFSQLAPALTEATNNLTSFVQGMTKAISESKLFAVAIDFLSNKMWNYIEAAASAITGISAETVGMNILADAMQKAGKQLAGLSQEWTDFDAKMTGTAAKKTPFSAPTDQAGQAAGQKAEMVKYETQIKLADEAFNQTKEHLGAEAKLHEITYDQETQQLLAALGIRYAAESAALAKEKGLYAQGSAEWNTVLGQQQEAFQKYQAEHQKITDQGLQQDVKAWQDALKPLESAFNSQLSGLLAGTETWGQAMKKVFADLVINIIEGFEKAALDKAILGLVKLLGGAGSGGGQSASGGGSIAGAAEGGIGGLIFGGLSKLLGGVLGFDVGTNQVMQTGLAMIHQGETIIPAAQGSGPYSGAGGGGTSVVHNWNINAIDGASVQRFFQTNAGQINRVLQNNMSLNPSLG